MRYIDLETHYRTLFNIVTCWHWDMETLHNLFPFERDIYVILLGEAKKELEKERE